MATLAVLLLLMVIASVATSYANTQQHDLAPYERRHGSKLNHRQIRECQPVRFGNDTYELYEAHRGEFNSTEEFDPVDVNTFALNIPGFPLGPSRVIKGHVTVVKDPLRTTTVLEPVNQGGCSQRRRGTVVVTSKQRKCLVAMNAGFFNTANGECVGNIVSDGRYVRNSGGIMNAQFGIQKNGKLLFGYLSEEELTSTPDRFLQLVSGVIWLLRDGENYVNHSMQSECPDSQETGTFERFVNVRSARTAIGHDKEGRLILLHVEGKTDQDGVNLWELADTMKHFGAINAINTDGGGSATFIWNGVLASYPSDACHDQNTTLTCARNVSTVFCIHGPECETDCGLHGECLRGHCVCRRPWSGVKCSVLPCHRDNCTTRGRCTEHGCICSQGWTGASCNTSCNLNQEHTNCSSAHQNDSSIEYFCKRCYDNLDDLCNTTTLLGNQENVFQLKHEQYTLWLAATIISACIAVIGLITSTVLLCSKYRPKRYHHARNRKLLPNGDAWDLSSSDEEDIMLQQSK